MAANGSTGRPVPGRWAGYVGVYIALWFVGLVKVAGGLLALALVQPWGRRLFRRWMLDPGGEVRVVSAKG